jgi:hypothetical protein
MAITGGQYAVTSTATSVTAALGLTSATRRYPRQLDIKNAAGATAAAYIGGSTVTNVPANAWAELSAGQAWSDVAIDSNHINTDQVFLVGTANAANILFITVVE